MIDAICAHRGWTLEQLIADLKRARQEGSKNPIKEYPSSGNIEDHYDASAFVMRPSTRRMYAAYFRTLVPEFDECWFELSLAEFQKKVPPLARPSTFGILTGILPPDGPTAADQQRSMRGYFGFYQLARRNLRETDAICLELLEIGPDFEHGVRCRFANEKGEIHGGSAGITDRNLYVNLGRLNAMKKPTARKLFAKMPAEIPKDADRAPHFDGMMLITSSTGFGVFAQHCVFKKLFVDAKIVDKFHETHISSALSLKTPGRETPLFGVITKDNALFTAFDGFLFREQGIKGPEEATRHWQGKSW